MSAIKELIREQIIKNLKILPNRITCSADLPSPEKRAIITDIFKSDPGDLYAPSKNPGKFLRHHNTKLLRM
jgi:hypothetical protein